MNLLVIGAGHNGLVAAAIAARNGHRVTVVDAAPSLGGACRTEYPFEDAPHLGCSTAAYLLGPMPPEVIAATGIDIQTMPRRPHGYFLTEDDNPVAFGLPGGRGTAALSAHDRAAVDALDAALAAMRDALAPLWLKEAVSVDESIRTVPDSPLFQPPHFSNGHGPRTIRDLYRVMATPDAHGLGGSVAQMLAPFDIQSPMLRAVIATDGFVGAVGGYDSRGTAMNFLAHNMLRLPPGDVKGKAAPLGAWQLVKGGMGAVTAALGKVISAHGGVIRLNTPVRHVRFTSAPKRANGVVLETGESIDADAVIVATDPFRARILTDEPEMSGLWSRLNAKRTPGTSLKVNMALKRLPNVVGFERLNAPPSVNPLSGTVHILPRHDTLAALERARLAALSGKTPNPDDMMVDVYTHTAVDESLCDPQHRHAMSFFVQWVPHELSVPDAEALAWALARGPVAQLLPELPDLIDDIMVLPPKSIERRFGITHGHIHHLDNGYAFDHRLAARTPIPNLLLAGAGCHPAGSVIGCAGYIAARALQS